MSRSPLIQQRPPDADQVGTQRLLEVLADFEVPVTFAFVGQVALDGDPPEHCPDQIRQVQAAGHEVASHSMRHRYLPALRTPQLVDTVSQSKQRLEECLGSGSEVRGFIPPFNQPRHFPTHGCFSFSEMLGLQGVDRRESWSPGRQTIGTVLRVLNQCGYGWCRIHYESKYRQIKRRFSRSYRPRPNQPFLLHDIVALPLHAVGFGKPIRSLIESYQDEALVLLAYGHPNQALSKDHDESADRLAELLEYCDPLRAKGRLQFHTMGQIEALVRTGRSEAAQLPVFI